MLTKANSAAAFFFLIAAIGQARARELPTPPVSAIVVSAERTQVGKAYDVNPDCSVGGKVTVRVVESPKSGTVEVVTEKGFTEFEKETQAYKCNEKQLDITAFYYTSKDGFRGKDRFTVEMFYANGNYRKRVFNVDVR